MLEEIASIPHIRSASKHDISKWSSQTISSEPFPCNRKAKVIDASQESLLFLAIP